ncbi:MAG: glycosyltransferase family 2 protein [Anaerolineales bacterium]|jgi:glycosyltransferase involved in cell wall biosynthesis
MAIVSVIIPTYNHADYLGFAVQSVLDQTFSDFEIIVVDDGSTDHTGTVLGNFDDPRLTVIRQSNAGLLAARNRGVSESSGPFVTFLDADDLFLPQKLAVLHLHLQNNPQTGFAAGLVRYVNQSGEILSVEESPPGSLDVKSLLFKNPVHVSAIMVRREWLDLVGGFKNERIYDACGDWDLWLKLSYAGCKMDWVEQVVTSYRIVPDQMSQNPLGMRESQLAVLNNFFAQPNLAPDMNALQNEALSSSLLNIAARAYYAGDYATGNNDLAQAINLNPNLTANHYERLYYSLIGWARAPYPLDSETYLNRIYLNLSDDLKELRPVLRKAMAEVALWALNESSTGMGMDKKSVLLRAIKNDRSLLLNRSVLRMLYDAFII